VLFNKEITILDIPSWAVLVVLLLARRFGHSLGLAVTLFTRRLELKKEEAQDLSSRIESSRQRRRRIDNHGDGQRLELVVRGPGHTLRRDSRLDGDHPESTSTASRVRDRGEEGRRKRSVSLDAGLRFDRLPGIARSLGAGAGPLRYIAVVIKVSVDG
jgi:hypothetical protein